MWLLRRNFRYEIPVFDYGFYMGALNADFTYMQTGEIRRGSGAPHRWRRVISKGPGGVTRMGLGPM